MSVRKPQEGCCGALVMLEIWNTVNQIKQTKYYSREIKEFPIDFVSNELNTFVPEFCSDYIGIAILVIEKNAKISNSIIKFFYQDNVIIEIPINILLQFNDVYFDETHKYYKINKMLIDNSLETNHFRFCGTKNECKFIIESSNRFVYSFIFSHIFHNKTTRAKLAIENNYMFNKCIIKEIKYTDCSSYVFLPNYDMDFIKFFLSISTHVFNTLKITVILFDTNYDINLNSNNIFSNSIKNNLYGFLDYDDNPKNIKKIIFEFDRIVNFEIFVVQRKNISFLINKIH